MRQGLWLQLCCRFLKDLHISFLDTQKIEGMNKKPIFFQRVHHKQRPLSAFVYDGVMVEVMLKVRL